MPPSASNVHVPSPSGPWRRAATGGRRCAPRRCATTRGVEPAPRGRRLDREVGRLGLAELDPGAAALRLGVAGSTIVSDRRDAARERGSATLRRTRAAGAGRATMSTAVATHDDHGERDRDGRRHDAAPPPRRSTSAIAARGDGLIGHRGTGTVEMAVATASSAV